MTYSEAIITFNSIPALNTGIAVHDALTGNSMSELFKAERLSAGQSKLGITAEQTAINYVIAFNYDWNGTALYTVSRVGNVVTIAANNPSSTFNETGNTTAGAVTMVINNYAPTVLSITDVSFVPATTNPVCTHYKVEATTNILADKVTSPINADPNLDNPITFEVLRNNGFILTVEMDDGQTLTQVYNYSQVPDILNSSKLSIQITNSPNGATVVATVASQFAGATFEYSLNNVDWQSDNVFIGLAAGDFTLYVRDPYGCTATLAFTVDADNVVEPYFYISKAMSLRYALRIAYGDCGPYKTDEDMLSCEEFARNVRMVKKETQQFQACDVLTTQLTSNYENISAKVIKEDGTEAALTVTKLTNYIGRKDMRDATKYNLGNGQTGIYFTSGNIYDYDTEVDTGEDYTLNGGLPEWAVVGNFMSIGGAWYEIVNNIYDTILGEVLVIDAIYTGAPTIIQVKSKYNRQKYEIYEYLTNMAAYNNQTIKVQFDLTDSRANFPDIQGLSEDILVRTRHSDTVDIRYYNDGNTDVYYKSGIVNQLRLPIYEIRGDHEDPSENLKADNKSDLLKSTVFELDEFIFEPVTKGMYRKLVQALSHKYVTIDGVAYIKNTNIEKEGPLEETNLYIIKAKMLKTVAPYTAQVVGIEPDIINNESTLEVPNLIISNNGEFIAYV